jgi:hypothetical protein
MCHEVGQMERWSASVMEDTEASMPAEHEFRCRQTVDLPMTPFRHQGSSQADRHNRKRKEDTLKRTCLRIIVIPPSLSACSRP